MERKNQAERQLKGCTSGAGCTAAAVTLQLLELTGEERLLTLILELSLSL